MLGDNMKSKEKREKKVKITIKNLIYALILFVFVLYAILFYNLYFSKEVYATEENANKESPFYNKKVVITGVFSIGRNDLAELLKKEGADINTAISRKTDFVFVGDDPGPSKMEKLYDLLSEGCDIKIITREMLDKSIIKSNE